MLLLVVSANAQFKWGIKAGANITEMSTSGAVLDASNRTGFYVGPTCKFTLPIVGLGLDLSAVYDQREAKISTDGSNESETVSRKTIAIPLNVRYQIIGLGDLASIFAYTGPQIAFNVGDKKLSFDDVTNCTLKSSTFSWNVGLGAFVANHVQINANYNIAVGRTSDQENFQDGLNEAVKSAVSSIFNASNNNSWQIGVAYFF